MKVAATRWDASGLFIRVSVNAWPSYHLTLQKKGEANGKAISQTHLSPGKSKARCLQVPFPHWGGPGENQRKGGSKSPEKETLKQLAKRRRREKKEDLFLHWCVDMLERTTPQDNQTLQEEIQPPLSWGFIVIQSVYGPSGVSPRQLNSTRTLCRKNSSTDPAPGYP